VVERTDLLNGARQAVLDGAGNGWMLMATVAWRIGLDAGPGEGEITLARADGDELYASAVSVAAEESPDGPERVTARLEIHGGVRAYDGAQGTATLEVTLAGDRFTGELNVDMSE
jgi:hypothetical protein